MTSPKTIAPDIYQDSFQNISINDYHRIYIILIILES